MPPVNVPRLLTAGAVGDIITCGDRPMTVLSAPNILVVPPCEYALVVIVTLE